MWAANRVRSWFVFISSLKLLFVFSLGNYGEIIIKTLDEYWITGKSSNDREFYVIIQKKNANVIEIAGKIKIAEANAVFNLFFVFL